MPRGERETDAEIDEEEEDETETEEEDETENDDEDDDEVPGRRGVEFPFAFALSCSIFCILNSSSAVRARVDRPSHEGAMSRRKKALQKDRENRDRHIINRNAAKE